MTPGFDAPVRTENPRAAARLELTWIRAMPDLRVCIDVPDLDSGIAFYTAALGLTPGRRLGSEWVELLGAPVPIDLVVTDLDAALAGAVAAGATLERPVSEAAWGRMAILADPFGHGLCLLQFHGRGYSELIVD